MKNRFFVCAFLSFLLYSGGFAQSPYHYSWNRDLPLVAPGIFFSATGHLYQLTIDPLSAADLHSMNGSQINDLDQPAIYFHSAKADFASDLLMYGGGAAAAGLFIDRKARSDFFGIALMGVETIALTDAATTWSKALFLRPRPYVFNPDVALNSKLTRNARFSFFSGHVSFTAGATFFAASVFSDLNPDSKWKVPVWILAATLPAATGYMRIHAGKHYLTDVMVGYITGAFFGIAIPAIHKKKAAGKISIAPSSVGKGIQFSWRF